MDADLRRAFALMDGDLYHVTGRHHDLKPFTERTRALLEAHWPAVDALAYALIEHRRIEGEDVAAIIDRSLRIFRPTGEHVKVET